MERFLLLILISWINPLLANQPVVFKKELVTNTHWSPYVLILFVLLAVLFILAQYSKKSKTTSSKCKVIEQVSVHNKTKIFVIDYQGQQFLLADNQNALTLLPLQDTELHHE
ncbi:flagellar biosynthetic protein FliO [Legionella quateirensis]|uniref:Flagellar biosynthetic protein FliO n=1 Tax=Legionella quateirensis TaxID=45072 RepID=A0A378KVN7_9GAMM|nr:flagellar biosynthetic protein FliO [Legionella quateirensis]KTD51325.1 hypothetical protein Lqua_1552 [Legionella quateirensis]STY17428.1 flagellar biosynthetic protein FliO [Legionella quateirensis]